MFHAHKPLSLLGLLHFMTVVAFAHTNWLSTIERESLKSFDSIRRWHKESLVPLHLVQPLKELRVIGRRHEEAHVFESAICLNSTIGIERRWYTRTEDLVQSALQCSLPLLANVMVRVSGPDVREMADENAYVLDGVRPRQDILSDLS